MFEDLFAEIFAELEDQGLPVKDKGSRALAPLVFHSRLMHPRIHMCECLLNLEDRPLTRESRLRNFRAKAGILWI
jgi:hypothetical protein